MKDRAIKSIEFEREGQPRVVLADGSILEVPPSDEGPCPGHVVDGLLFLHDRCHGTRRAFSRSWS